MNYYSEEKFQDFLSVYWKLAKEFGNNPNMKRIDVVKMAVNSPAKKFYVSEEQATKTISDMLKGKDVISRPAKKEMYAEIMRRYNKMRAENQTLKTFDIVSIIVNQPAPKFYIDDECAYYTINNYYLNRKKNSKKE
jgi:hypothetical protein